MTEIEAREILLTDAENAQESGMSGTLWLDELESFCGDSAVLAAYAIVPEVAEHIVHWVWNPFSYYEEEDSP